MLVVGSVVGSPLKTRGSSIEGKAINQSVLSAPECWLFGAASEVLGMSVLLRRFLFWNILPEPTVPLTTVRSHSILGHCPLSHSPSPPWFPSSLQHSRGWKSHQWSTHWEPYSLPTSSSSPFMASSSQTQSNQCGIIQIFLWIRRAWPHTIVNW